MSLRRLSPQLLRLLRRPSQVRPLFSSSLRPPRPPPPVNLRAPPFLRPLCGAAGSAPSPPQPRLHIVFTCTRCDTRATKSFSKQAYEHGVVLVTCPGCQGRHVIADNLGWFGEHKNVEEILASKGQDVVTVTDADIDYSP